MRALGNIWLDRSGRLTLQEQLVLHFKELIQGGTLHAGEAVPSSRELAEQLQISRNTVVYAYDRLTSEGYFAPVSRSGVFVSSSISFSRPAKGSKRPIVRRVLKFQEPAAAPRLLGSPCPFRPCQPDVTLFPLLIWNRLRGRALREQGRNFLHYQSSCVPGFPQLRELLASYLRDSRGVRCDWRQIVITSGSQQALYILANLLLRAGDHVYMEDPGYLEARFVWQNAGARIYPGPLDEQGLKLPPRNRSPFALIYTTPSRQFPTGISLSLARRLALIDYAAKMKTWIVEDDYDSELAYRAAPLPSLQSLDQGGRVIYVGTFSKLLFPSLRLGYVVVPEDLLEDFIRLKHLIDDHLPLIDQATLASFLESGAFYSHIRRCRKAYAERQELFLQFFHSADLPIEFPYTDGGMNLTGLLPAGANDAEWTRRLRSAGFDVPALSSFAVGRSRPGLVFGFTAFNPAAIRGALERMLPLLGQNPRRERTSA